MTSVHRGHIRLLYRDRALWGLVTIAMSVSLIASLNGRNWQERRESVAMLEPVSLARLEDRRAHVPEEGRAPVTDAEKSAMNAFGVAFDGHYTALPAGPIAGIAIGRSDADPIVGRISLWTPVHELLPAAEPINPVHVWIGQFDPAFAIVYVLPLLLIAVAHDGVAREAAGGTLALLRAQPVSVRTVLWARLWPRAVLVVAPLVIVPPLVVAWGDTAAARELLLLSIGWWAIVMVYAAFWTLIAVAVNACGWSAATSLVVLVGTWLTLVVAVPQVLGAAVELAAPRPPRFEYLQALRNAQTRAEDDTEPIRARYLAAHPETKPRPGQDGFIAPYFLQMWSIAQEMMPTIDAFDEAVARQQRLADMVGVVSPALVAHDALTELAGSNARDMRAFREQTLRQHRAWHAYFASPVFLRQPMTAALYEAMPRSMTLPRPLSVRMGHVFVATVVLTGFLIGAGILARVAWRKAGLG